MADPRQVVFSPVNVDDAEYADYEPDPKMAEENAEFEAFKSEMHESQDQAKITVSKKMTDSRGRPVGKQMFECFECGIDDYSFSQICSRIRDDFGTGLYQILGRNSKGAYKFRKTVGILAPNSVDNVPAQNDVGGLIDKFSDAMQRQQMATEQMFLKLTGPQTGGDAMDQMTKMASAMATIMGAMGIERQAPTPPKTLVEQLTEFKMIKELFGGGESDGIGGEANLYSLLGETVKAFGGPIATAIAAGAQSGELNKDGLAALPAPEQTEAEKMGEQEKHDMAMRQQIHILIQNAKTKIPPEHFAGILVNHTPDDKQDELWDFISDEKCVDTIISLEPAAEPYRQWFDELRTAVINLMAEPVEPDQPEQEIEPEKEKLQDDSDGSNVPESDAVAGVDTETATSDSKSDSNTSEHT